MRVFDHESVRPCRSKAERALTGLGVEVRTIAPVEAIACEGVAIAGRRLPAKTVIWTAGVAASPAGQWLGAEMDRECRSRHSPPAADARCHAASPHRRSLTLIPAVAPSAGCGAPRALVSGKFFGADIVVILPSAISSG